MKKVIVGIIITCTLLFPLLFINNNKELLITTFKKSYSIVSKIDEKDKLEILIYINNKKASLLDKEKIVKSYISSEDAVINLKIDKVTDLNYTQMIKENKFNLYSFVFDIEFNSNNEYSVFINNAILNIELIESSYNLNIGTLSYNKVLFYGDIDNSLSVSQIIPVINKLDVNDSILGIGLKIRNFSKNNIIIKDIEFLDYNIKPSLYEIKEVDISEINNKNISEILGYSYNYNYQDNITNDEIIIYVEEGNEYEFLLPIKYIKTYPIDSFGMEITFSYEGTGNKEYKYYFDDYVFFKSNYITYKNDDIIINKYEIS